MISRALASWWGILGIWIFCAGWLAIGLPRDALTLALSVIALTFTQLVLREQHADTVRWDRKMDELIHAVPDADDGVADT